MSEVFVSLYPGGNIRTFSCSTIVLSALVTIVPLYGTSCWLPVTVGTIYTVVVGGGGAAITNGASTGAQSGGGPRNMDAFTIKWAALSPSPSQFFFNF